MIFAILVCSLVPDVFALRRNVNLLAFSSADLESLSGVPGVASSVLFGGLVTVSLLNLFLILFVFPDEHVVVTDLDLFL